MRKRIISIILPFILIFCLVLSGCGSSSKSSNKPSDTSTGINLYNGYGDSLDKENYDYTSEDIEELNENQNIPDPERKIIKNAEMNVETKILDKTIADFKQIVEQVGGYIESEQIDGSSWRYDSYYERNAFLVARIPADKLDEVMDRIGKDCNVTARYVSSKDISETYYDTEAHLNNLKLQEKRLLDILSKATSLDDIIKLEGALSDVRYEIESLEAGVRRMDSMVSYSTLSLNFFEVTRFSEVSTEPTTFGGRISEAAHDSLVNIGDTLEGILIFIIAYGPSILIWLIIIFVIVFLIIKLVRAIRSRSGKKELLISGKSGNDKTENSER